MPVYSVHIPPPTAVQSGPERFVFVRDGFSFWAFLLGAVWMLWHRLWLILAGYCLLAITLILALRGIGVSSGGQIAAGVLIAVLVGLEAATLRRIGLARRGWRSAGIVVGDDVESAEQRFFDSWVAHAEGGPARASAAAVPASGHISGQVPGAPAPGTEIVGLFPSPGGGR